MTDFLSASPLGRALRLLLISMLPVVELRGGIPYGLYQGMPWIQTYIICVIGNMIPVPFVILFIRKIFEFLKRWPPIGRFIERLEKRALNKADKIVKYEMLGLFLFVAIPLPGTGAWTGALIAALLDLRLKNAVPVIFLGVLVAGAIVSLASFGLLGVFGAIAGV